MNNLKAQYDRVKINPIITVIGNYHIKEVDGYIAAVFREERPRAWEERQSPEQGQADTVMIGLWLTGGLDRVVFETRLGRPFEFFYGEQLERLKGDGLMGESASAVWLTERGLLLSNYVLAELV
jgi:coproporphyrinogen III oxidase-like Fe-S oxidoreductase